MPQLKAPPAKAEWSQAAIGETAGRVWQYLRRAGKASPADIEREIEPKALAWTGIGWLAREGKLAFGQDGRTTTIRLSE